VAIKDVYRVGIRLLGVYILVNYVISNFSYLFFGAFTDYNIRIVLSAIIAVVIVLFVIHLMIFRTDRIIELLRLDKGHASESIETNQVTPKSLYLVVIVCVGLLLLTNNVVTLLTQIYYAIEVKLPNEAPMTSNFRLSSLIYAFISIGLGLFLTMNASRLAKWFISKNNQE
jgi:hypothetical protein